MTKNIIIPVILGFFFFTSCTSYLIPVESFKQQFSGIDSTSMIEVTVQTPFGGTYNYLANPIRIIKCEDKNGNYSELKNSPSIETRFTYGAKNKKTIFFFDQIFVNDSTVSGAQSRLIPSLIKTIPLQSVTKIEIQEGKKKYRYVGQ